MRSLSRRSDTVDYRRYPTTLSYSAVKEYAFLAFDGNICHSFPSQASKMRYVQLGLYCFCVLLLGACGGGGGSSAPPITVTVTPPMASVMVGQQIQLAAEYECNRPGDVVEQ